MNATAVKAPPRVSGVPALPPWAQEHIRELRAEAARHRAEVAALRAEVESLRQQLAAKDVTPCD